MIASTTEIRDQVRQFILDEFVYADEIRATLKDDTALIDENILDSFGVHTLIVFLEERFGIAVLDAEVRADNLGTIHAVASFVQYKHSMRE
jgi:acyl carrier protein